MNDVYAYFRRIEPKFRAPANYMETQVRHGGSLLLPVASRLNKVCCFLQPDINEKMRAILIDWLVEVHLKFKVRRCQVWSSVTL